jgi:hypothetical protein
MIARQLRDHGDDLARTLAALAPPTIGEVPAILADANLHQAPPVSEHRPDRLLGLDLPLGEHAVVDHDAGRPGQDVVLGPPVDKGDGGIVVLVSG